VIGPEATSAALVATAVAPLADGDPSRYLVLASMLALLVGAGFLLARLVRLGWVADYLSRAALVGFVHGIVVILVCGQLGKLTGVPISADSPVGQIADLVRGLDELSVTTLVTGLIALAFLFGLKAVAPKSPGPLFLVVGAIVVSIAFSLADHGVESIGAIPSGLPTPSVPRVGIVDTLHLCPAHSGSSSRCTAARS
jgi:MFS superfamily sulfate permease-like transporter